MDGRREFLKHSVLAGVAAAISPVSYGRDRAMPAENFSKPKRLAQGDTVGVIAPASNAWENDDVRYALEIVESLGFKAKPGQFLFKRDGYLAGRDEERANDVQSMFEDDQVDAIMCLRGGYGTLRMLHHLDFERIAKHPKVFIGYSDITVLLNAISSRSKMVTFHGPVARQEFTDYTLAEFKRVLMGESDLSIPIGSPPPFEAGEGRVERVNRLVRIHPGHAQGRLIGGNLSLMTKLVGSPYEPDYRNKILILEEVDERPYRIDGMLTHLIISGRITQVAGIAFGKCSDCDAAAPPSLSLERVLEDRLGTLGVPVLRGLMMGHVRDQTTVPIGVQAKLDVDAGTLTLLEQPVS